MEKAIFINYRKCVGCKTCEMICSLLHEGICTSSLSRIHVIRDEKAGWNIPVTCVMCEKPVCVNLCPVGAILKSPENGLVTIEDTKCIGCRLCVLACPFGHINFSQQKGTAFKCDRCDEDPQCVKFCWTEAISYIPLDIALEQKRQIIGGKMLSE